MSVVHRPLLAAFAGIASLLVATVPAVCQDDSPRERVREEADEADGTERRDSEDVNRRDGREDDGRPFDRLDRDTFERLGLGSIDASVTDLEDQERGDDALRGEIDQFMLHASVRGAAMDEILIPSSGQLVRLGRARLLGDWEMRGFLSQSVTWDDNVFQLSRRPIDDVISESTLGFRFTRFGTGMVVDATGAGTVEAHMDHPEHNRVNGFLRAGSQWNFGRGYFRVFDIFAQRDDSVIVDLDVKTTATVINGVFFDRVRQTTNIAGAATGYRGEKLQAEARYEVTSWEYGRHADGLDANQHELIVHTRYPVTPRLDVDLDLNARIMEFEQDLHNDWDAYGTSMGWNWVTTEKVRTYGRVGYLVQDSDRTGTIPESQDYSGPFWMGGMRWNATPKVDLVATYSGDIYRSPGANYQMAQVLGARAEWRFAPRWRLDATTSLQFSDVSRGEDFRVRSHSLRLGWFLEDTVEVALQWNYIARATGLANGQFKNHRAALQFTVFF